MQPVIVLATCSRRQRWASALIWFQSSIAGTAAGQAQSVGPEPRRLFAGLPQVPGRVGDAFEHGPDEMA